MTMTPVNPLQMALELPGMRRVEAAATKPAVASRSEIGYAQATLSQWWLFDEGETTPELQWPRSIAVYDQMRRTDAQVTSLLEAVSLPIRRTPWRLDPAGARATVVKFVATDLGLPIVGKGPGKAPARTKGKFSWPDHLRLSLLMLVFGHMFFEQVYAVNDAGTEAHLKKLAPRMPSTIDQIKVAADGGLEWIKQRWTTDNGSPAQIPVDRLVAYVRNREGGNWLGQSILRPAYKNWLLKDRLLRVQAQTIERNGMGIPLYKAQEGATSDDITAGKTMATLWRAGEAAGSAIPYGADLVLRGVEGTLPDADPAIRYHDEQIARAALAHFLNLGTQTGSWALGATFADFFVYSLQTLAQQIADVTTQHVIEDLVDLNFGEDEPAPKLVFDEIGSQQAATAQALKMLVDAGIVHPDQVLEESSRQQYGLPPADPSTATLPPGQPEATPAVERTPTGALSVAARRASRRRTRGPAKAAPRREVRARYNPQQLRDSNGEWGDGAPGPGLDLEGFDLAAEVDGTFGTVQMGTDPAGDVRFAFREGEHDRALDLGGDELGEMHTALQELADYRDEVGTDAPSSELVDDRWFGTGQEHKVSLWGNGVVEVTFGAEDDDPWTLLLDPPDGDGSDDVQTLLDGIGDTLGELGDTAVHAAAGHDTHPGGEELKHYWLYGEGAAKWSTWTELYNHLRSGKGLTDAFAKRIAAAWFHIRYGDWPGDHRNVHASAEPFDDEAAEWEELVEALILALAELKGEVRASAFDEAKHPRGPGGKFRSTVDKLKHAIETHRSGGGQGDPFDGFDREQLRRAAKTRNIALGRGEDRDSIAKKLIEDLGGPSKPASKPAPKPGAPTAPKPKAAPRKRAPRKAPAKPEPDPADAAGEQRVAKVRDILGKEGYEDFDVLSALQRLESGDLDRLTADERAEVGRELRGMVRNADPGDRAEARKIAERLGVDVPAAPETPAAKAAAGTYDGPMFAYSSPEQAKLADELAALKGRELRRELPFGDPAWDRIDELQAGFTPTERAHIVQQAVIQSEFDRWVGLNRSDMSEADLKADMQRRSEAAWAGKPVALRVTPKALSGILADGRLKTQFETGTSKGLLDNNARARAEAKWFGLDANSDPKTRPIYGYLAVEGVRPAGKDHEEDQLSQYGRIQVVLKDEVRDRTTAQWGDSLNFESIGIPEPVNAPTWRSYSLASGGIGSGQLTGLDRDVTGAEWRQKNYVEAQVHGGVGVSDIAEVVLPSSATKTLKAQLDAAGIPWRVL